MMLSINRRLAKTLRSVFRKASDGHGRCQGTVIIRADDDQLRVQFHNGNVVVEYRGGEFAGQGTVSVPLNALTDFEGAKDDPVQLSADAKGNVRAEWIDHGVPLHRQYPASPSVTWLERPSTMTPLGEGRRLRDLAEVVECTSQSSVKFTLDSIQLRGHRGQVVGSDGHQLLIAGGFTFPWDDNVLVARTDVFGCRELNEGDVRVGRTERHVVFEVGSWTAWLTIKDGRYPNVDQIIPKMDGSSRVILNDADVAMLVPALTRLPGNKEPNSPVTIHANGQVVIQAADDGGPPTKFVMSQSHVEGKEVLVAVNRHFLKRAIQLGIRELQVHNDQIPIVAQNERITYVWVPLHKSAAVPPTSETQPTGSLSAIADSGSSQPTIERSEPIMNNSNHSASAAEDLETSSTAENLDPLQEAEAIKVQLREVQARISELIVGIKRQRKQAQIVRSTLASLKQLQVA